MPNTTKEKIIFFDITGKCNLRCLHCYQWEIFQKEGRDAFELGQEEIKKTIDKLAAAGFNRLHILGGEPLLSPQLIPTIKYAKDKQFIVSLVTNGTLLSSRVKDLVENKVDLLSVSFEGVRDSTHDYIRGRGSYAKTLAEVDKTLRMYPNFPLAAVFTINAININDVAFIPDWLQENNFFGVNIQIIGMEGNACNNPGLKINIEDALEELEKILPIIVAKKREIDIKVPNLVKKYLEIRSGADLGITRDICKGLTRQIYWSRGNLMPCNAAVSYVKPLNYNSDDIGDTCFKQTGKSFRRFVEDKGSYKDIIPCRTCLFFGKYCLPCPINTVFLNKNYQLDSCMWAMEKISQLKKEWLNSNIVFRTENSDVRLTGWGQRIFQRLQLNKTFDFIETVPNQLEDTMLEMIQFWNFLKNNNMVDVQQRGGDEL